MQTRPITAEAVPEAVAILSRGFPKTTEAFWRRGLRRIQRTGSPDDQGSIGVLVEKDGAVVGVLLTLASQRAKQGEAHPVVNFSSWYLEPSARAFAPLMLRQLSRDGETLFTDLTASRAVRRMLPMLGFRAVSSETMMTPTLRVALRGRRGHLLSGRKLLANLGAADRKLVEDHVRLGCLACGLKIDGAVLPLVFLPRKHRRIVPTAQLVYTPSRRAVFDHLPLVAAFLARRGKMFLEMDLHPGDNPEVPHVRKRCGERFVKGPYPDDAIDYAYSELVYLGVR